MKKPSRKGHEECGESLPDNDGAGGTFPTVPLDIFELRTIYTKLKFKK